MSAAQGADGRWRVLFERRTLGVRLGLEAVVGAWRALGGPAATIPAVHVVGTNGKGSIAAMVAHALGRKGRRVGLYTSPHLHRVGERVRIAGSPIADEELLDVVDAVLAREVEGDLPRPLSFFELLTLAALVVFERQGVDVVVAEAGLGGRLDATRLVSPCVHAMARIALDHEAYLGSTLKAIAGEKAAVFRRDVPCVSAPQSPEVVDVLRAAAAEVNAPLRFVAPLDRSPQGLVGDHQRENAAVALAVASVIEPSVLATDLDGVSWPGRLERVAVGQGAVVFDVAHNPDGIAAFVQHLKRHGGSEDPIVFGCLADKDAATMQALLATTGQPIWTVPPPSEAAADLAGALGSRRFTGVDDPAFCGGWDQALSQGRTVWVCGSHVLVAVLRARALGFAREWPQPADPLSRAVFGALSPAR